MTKNHTLTSGYYAEIKKAIGKGFHIKLVEASTDKTKWSYNAPRLRTRKEAVAHAQAELDHRLKIEKRGSAAEVHA